VWCRDVNPADAGDELLTVFCWSQLTDAQLEALESRQTHASLRLCASKQILAQSLKRMGDPMSWLKMRRTTTILGAFKHAGGPLNGSRVAPEFGGGFVEDDCELRELDELDGDSETVNDECDVGRVDTLADVPSNASATWALARYAVPEASLQSVEAPQQQGADPLVERALQLDRSGGMRPRVLKPTRSQVRFATDVGPLSDSESLTTFIGGHDGDDGPDVATSQGDVTISSAFADTVASADATMTATSTPRGTRLHGIMRINGMEGMKGVRGGADPKSARSEGGRSAAVHFADSTARTGSTAASTHPTSQSAALASLALLRASISMNNGSSRAMLSRLRASMCANVDGAGDAPWQQVMRLRSVVRHPHSDAHPYALATSRTVSVGFGDGASQRSLLSVHSQQSSHPLPSARLLQRASSATQIRASMHEGGAETDGIATFYEVRVTAMRCCFVV
jgi:hypothetical protein